jgi:hypothetical protein
VPCSGTVAQWIRIIKILTISEDAEKRYLRCSAGHFNAEFSQTSSGSSAMGQSTNMSFHLLGGNNIRMSEKANRFVVTSASSARAEKGFSVCEPSGCEERTPSGRCPRMTDVGVDWKALQNMVEALDSLFGKSVCDFWSSYDLHKK